MSHEELEAIKARHSDEQWRWDATPGQPPGAQSHQDRGALLALVDRLEREVQEMREVVMVLQHERGEGL